MHSLWLHCVEKLLLSPTKAETGVTSSASRDGRRWRTDPATWEGLIEKEKCVSKNSSLTQQISLLGRPDAASARSDGVYMYKEIPQLVWGNSLTGGGVGCSSHPAAEGQHHTSASTAGRAALPTTRRRLPFQKAPHGLHANFLCCQR